MMRFKKGSKVEVLNQREVPFGSWRPAEIISGNGHTYYVKYESSSPDIGASVERVPRKALRPCPTSVEGSRPWMRGDIVEVFDIYSWKIAEISSALGDDYFCVRLLGYSRKFKAHMSDLRLRQSWKGNKWFVIGQLYSCSRDSEKSKDGKMNERSKVVGARFHKLQTCMETKQCLGGGKGLFSAFSSGMKRRRDTCLLPCETCAGGARRKIVVQKGRWCPGEVAVHSSHLFEKVDAVVSPQKTPGEKYMHTSLNNGAIGFSEMEIGRAIDEYKVLRSFNHDNTESITPSVGSCSWRNGVYRSPQNPVTGLSEDLGSSTDDADSFSGAGGQPPLPIKEVSVEKIHQLELRAYCSTLAELYASGPISWKQETFLTNLRLTLHISNDEHLMEIRHLVSAK